MAAVQPLGEPLLGGPLGAAVALLVLHDLTDVKLGEQQRADFVANASHELRTPLASLIGFIETLQGAARDDVEARDRFLSIMLEQARRMTRLVEDLLSLSRIELREHTPPTGRVALEPLLRRVAETLEISARRHGTTIAFELEPGLPDVAGDPDERAQVFQNVLDNAVTYGRPGTEVAVGGASVSSGRQAAIGAVAVAVRDHGEGIPRHHLPRLTERFYRVDPARSRELGGTGLGLAIVKHIVSRHRGHLAIDSHEGTGTTVTVTLPVAHPKSRHRHETVM
jgi:two-component system phosphate regulon sensor histidine kinase PhoR